MDLNTAVTVAWLPTSRLYAHIVPTPPQPTRRTSDFPWPDIAHQSFVYGLHGNYSKDLRHISFPFHTCLRFPRSPSRADGWQSQPASHSKLMGFCPSVWIKRLCDFYELHGTGFLPITHSDAAPPASSGSSLYQRQCGVTASLLPFYRH